MFIRTPTATPTLRRPVLAIFAGVALALASLVAPALAQERGGTWQGTAGHTATGTVSIVEEGGAYTVVFSDDWSIDNAPDPYIAFGSADAFADGTDFALVEKSGGQSFAVPEGIDPAQFEAAWVWCKRFGVPLAVATLK